MEQANLLKPWMMICLMYIVPVNATERCNC